MKILIITEYFAPVLAIASVRWTKLAKYLSQDHGYEVELLTNEKDYSGKSAVKSWSANRNQYMFDESLISDLDCLHNTYYLRMPFLGALFARLVPVGKALGSFIHRQRASMPKHPENSKRYSTTDLPLRNDTDSSRFQRLKHGFASFISEQIEWSLGNSSAIRHIDIQQYDVIVSTFGPKWTHYIARRIKQLYPEVIWMADYRDPVSNEAYYGASKGNEAFAESVTGEADCITAVSEGCLHNLYLAPEQRAYVVPNGFDIDLPGEKEQEAGAATGGPASSPLRGSGREGFDLVYTGTIYSAAGMRQDLKPIYQALERLGEAGRIDLSKVRVVYAGATGEDFDAHAVKHPHVQSVNLGLVDRGEALSLQRSAACLVFLAWNTAESQGVVTGKIFEYLASGTPIVGFVSGDAPGAIATEMIGKARAGVCVEEPDLERDAHLLDDFIAEKYAEWEATGTTSSDPDWDYIDTFSYANRARQVDGIIREIIAEREAAGREGNE